MPSSLDALESYGVNLLGFCEVERPVRYLSVSLSHPHPAVSYDVISRYFEQIAERFRHSSSRPEFGEDEIRHYTLPVSEAFHLACKQYPSISVDPEVMAGAPCIEHTRIPVYMILDAIEHYGNVDGALRSYPTMNLQQVRDAIGFAKLVVECPLDDEPQSHS